MKINLIETILLGLIAEKQNYAYELEKLIQKRKIREIIQISFSSIYNSLLRLEKKKLIKSVTKKQSNLPPQKIYKILPAGKKKLIQNLEYLISESNVLSREFDIGILNEKHLNQIQKRKFLEKRIKNLKERKKYLEEKIPDSQKTILKREEEHIRLEIELIKSILKNKKLFHVKHVNT